MKNSVKRERIRKGFSQKEFANLLGVSRQCISKVENERGEPSASLLLGIGKIIGIPVEQVFTLDSVLHEKQ